MHDHINGDERQPLLRALPNKHGSLAINSTIVASNGSTNEDDNHVSSTNDIIEHKLSFRQAAKLHPTAIFWSLFFSLGVIMCAFDGQVLGNLYATPAFQRDFGYFYKGRWIIPAPWQTALSMGGGIGTISGALFAAYPMDKLGRKTTFGICVVLTSICVAIQFSARSLRVLFVGEFCSGLIAGTYAVIAPAYASEVCPLALKGVLTAFTNLAYVLGQLLANSVLAVTSRLDSHWAYSAAFAVQWIWPAIILSGLSFAPESPWWLQRQNRLNEAELSLQQLSSAKVDVAPMLAQIIETDRLERKMESGSTYADCFKHTNLRRTIIGTSIYCIQVLSGIYLVGYSTYFFELAGIPTTQSFSLSIMFLLLGAFGTLTSFVLIPTTSHRSIILWGLFLLSTLQFTIAIIDCVPSYTQKPHLAYIQALLMLIWNYIYGSTLGPLTFVVLTTVSSTRLRSKTIALATCIQAIVGLGMNILIPFMFNPDQLDARGKIGFMFGSLAALSLCWCYYFVPELKGLSSKEVDVLFEKRIDARDFARYSVVVEHSITT